MARHPCEDKATRQAVVFIHGIGEPRPMQTLREFVKAVKPLDLHPKSRDVIWSKPDLTSGSFELRRLTTDFDPECRRTDFFEFYWAHMMEDTRMPHVVRWIAKLLHRRPWAVPRRLFLAYLFSVVVVAVVLGIPVASVLVELEVLAAGTVVVVLLAAAAAVYAGFRDRFLIPVLGDAARYLDANPDNVKIRHAIRQGGIDLLEALHDEVSNGRPKYDRIVIVGHSLGSVIGYDLLAHLWPRFHRRFSFLQSPDTRGCLSHAATGIPEGAQRVGQSLAHHRLRDRRQPAHARRPAGSRQPPGPGCPRAAPRTADLPANTRGANGRDGLAILVSAGGRLPGPPCRRASVATLCSRLRAGAMDEPLFSEG